MSDHAITHPAWCDPAECDVETHDLEGFGTHRSRPVLLDLGLQVLTDVTSIRVQLQLQPRPWQTNTYLTFEAGRARATVEISQARRMLQEVGGLLGEAVGVQRRRDCNTVR